MVATSSSDDEDFDKDAIHHLRLLFEDHPSLNDYIQLNDQEGISSVDELMEFF